MKFTETVITSIKSLRSNKVRSFLTMLGVIIGVFAVVSLVSLVKGVQNYVQDQFNSLGSNLVFVVPGRGGLQQGDPAIRYTNNKLDLKNIATIKNSAGDYISEISPMISSAKDLKYKSKNYYAMIYGVDVSYEKLVKMQLPAGRFFNKNEVDSSARVVVLGYQVKKELFGDSNPISRTIQLDGKSFTVIGYEIQKSQDSDTSILIPYTTVKNTLGASKISDIIARIKPDKDVDIAMKQIELALYKDLTKDDFTVMSQQDILSSVQRILGILAVGLTAVAGISLLVGGIGIMNIMLVSVTERISEIGLRKAVGATSGNIGFQFLFESMFLSVSGGIIGLLFGWLATVVAQPYLKAEIPWWTILLSLAFSIAVGIGFGTYPAIKASKLDPIEALRYE